MEDDFDVLDFTADLDISALCCDEEFNGFDKQNGSTWIYPTNYPVRDYQFNIIKAGLFKNTLVSLPTGLGKTFIAAVIMFNFYRWYPMGKIIFVAPTRPLVAQQIDACYNIMAIPPDDTIEMTGTMSITNRKAAWLKKRVIFATPQVVQNDLESGNCPSELVRCLVIDEAHKAKGRYSFCQIVELLTLKKHQLFRVLALSATPGSKVDDVIQVVKNLKISHLELRSEECIDVAAYSFHRKIQTVVVPLGEELSSIRNQFLEILDKYTRRLVQCKVLTSNIGTLSKGRIIMLYKEYQTRERGQRHSQHGLIMLDFTMVITLYHALELLTRHGARVFLNFFDDHPDKTWVGKDDRLVSFLERLRDDLGVNPMSLDLSTFPDGSIPEIKDRIVYGHPKFDHLKREVSEHFNNAKYRGQKTKAIIFCEYRESVNLVHCLLLQCRPLIKPQIFIGQGPGSGTSKDAKAFSQKQQLKVMQLFREGVCNVLVSTCVGEEGLDIGNVDLIICFDISNKSPVRLVQRCGRTGRERSGRVVILVTEGKEHQTLQDCIYERDNLNKKILQSKQLQESLFKSSPRMVPLEFKPECQKMYITVAKKIEVKSKSKKVQSKLKDMLVKSSRNINSDSEDAFISKEEYISSNSKILTQLFTDSTEIWNKTKDFVKKSIDFGSDKSRLLSKWTEYQRNLQYTSQIGHSIDSEIYTKLLQFADSKRFHTEAGSSLKTGLTQINYRKKDTETLPKKSINNKKQSKPLKGNTDIRKMFRNVAKANNDEEAIFSCKMEEFLNKYGIDISSTESISEYLRSENISPLLIDLMVELELEQSQVNENVNSIFSETSVRDIDKTLPKAVLPDYCFPDISRFNGIGSVSWDCLKSSMYSMNCTMTDAFSELEEFCPCPEINENECSVVAHNYETQSCSPKKYDEIKDKTIVYNENCKTSNFDLIDMDAIFGDSFSSQNNNELKTEDKHNLLKDNSNFNDKVEHNLASFSQNETKKGLDFFGLDDIDTIFGNSFASPKSNEADSKNKNNNNLKNSVDINEEKNCSDVSENNVTKTGLEFFGLDDIEDLYLNNSSDESKNDLEMNIIETPDTDHNDDSNQSIENVLSPIISSQIPKKTKIHQSTEYKSIQSFQKSLKESNKEADDDSTFFSISQAINFVSSDDKLINIGTANRVMKPNGFSNNKTNIHANVHEEESNDSDGSVIISSQATKRKFPMKKMHPKQFKPNIIIPASSDESDTSDDIEHEKLNIDKVDSNQNLNKTNSDDLKCNVSTSNKRELSSDEELSPFFHKLPKIMNLSLKDTSLARKNMSIPNISKLKNLTSSMMKENVCPDVNNVSSINISIDHDVSTYFETDVNGLGTSNKQTLNLNKFKCPTNRSFDHLNSSKVENRDSDDDFVEKSFRQFPYKNDKSVKENKKTKVKKKKKACEFIDYEAILSDDSYEGGSSEDKSGSDTTLGSFICDENDDADVSIDIESKYLESIKSPVNNGKFKIPKLPENIVDVFSQECPAQDTSYELDSFCIGNDHGLTQANEWTELEIAESLLKKRKRKKKKRIVHNLLDDTIDLEGTSQLENKRKRVRLRINSDDSE